MKKIIISFLFLFSLLNVEAQDTIHLSLEYLLQEVETNYPSLKQFHAAMKAWEEKANGSKAWMPPSLTIGLSRFPVNPSLINDNNNPMNQAGIPIGFEQMIPNFGKQRAENKWLLSKADIEKSQEKWTLNEIRKFSKTVYFDKQVFENNRKIIIESKHALQQIIAIAEAQISTQAIELKTIYKLNAKLAEINNTLLQVNVLIEERNIALNTLLQRNITLSIVADSLSISPENMTIPLEENEGFLQRSDIDLLSKTITSLEFEQQIVHLSKRPDFGLRAEYMPMLGMTDQWGIMAKINIPLSPWSVKSYTASSKFLTSKIEQLEWQKKAQILQAEKDKMQKQIQVKSKVLQYENFQNEIIPAYKKHFSFQLQAYRENTGNLFELFDAWELLLIKKIELNNLILTLLKTKAEYEFEIESL